MCDAVFLVNRNPNSDPETRDTDHHAATELHGIVANPKTSWRSDSVPTAQILGAVSPTSLTIPPKNDWRMDWQWCWALQKGQRPLALYYVSLSALTKVNDIKMNIAAKPKALNHQCRKRPLINPQATESRSSAAPPSL